MEKITKEILEVDVMESQEPILKDCLQWLKDNGLLDKAIDELN